MAIKLNIRVLVIATGLVICGLHTLVAQGPDDYFVGHGFVDGDTVFTNSGTFWDDGFTSNYSPTGNWDVYFCTTAGNPYPLTLEFKGFATHYGGSFPISFPLEYLAWDYMRIRYGYAPAADYYAYHDDTPEFSFTAEDGCIHIDMVKNGDANTHSGWEAEIYAIPPPSNNDPCSAAHLTVGNVCTPQVFTNKGAYRTGGYASPCHTYFGGDVWFSAVVPASGNLKIESFPGSLEWAVMNIYTGSSCTGLTHYACIEDSIGMPTAHLSGFTPGDTVFIRMFGDQAKSGTFGMCASDPTTQIKGHTGPGGVGDDSTNVIWLRADMGVLNNSDLDASNGEAVKTWLDQSGNSNHVGQSTGSLQPVLTNNVINGMPVLRLDGSDDYMSAELNSLSAPLALLAVSRFTASGADDHLMSMGDEVSTVKTVSISRENDNRYYSFTDNAKWYGPTLNDNTPYLIHAVHNVGAAFHELFINETAQSSSDYTTSVVTDGSLYLGASRNIDNFLGGDIAEFIIYKQKLNTAQKIIVENFLAAKYGISITTDRYAFEAAHGYDVAGIGQVDAGNRHTEAQSAATISIGNPTDLDDGEFVLFGHDNGDMSSWTSTERPNNDPNIMRIAREWVVDLTGDPGTLTITLNDSLLPALLPGFNNYTLWTDTDGDFTSGATAVPLVRVDGEFVANTVNLADGVYITISAVMPVVRFSQDSSAELESVTNPDIEVELNYAVNEEVSVVFRSINGTATGGGTDYLLNPGTATFPAGSTTVNIQPTIINDTIVELPDEYFEIRLSDPDPGLILSADSSHTYTILNNDIDVSASTDTDTIGECGLVSANLSAIVNGTGPFSYVWTPASGLSDDSISNPIATPASDTWYKITVTDLTNGAVGSDSIHIAVIPKPAQPIITPGGSTTFCVGDSVQLSASAGYSWLWSTGETTQDIYVSLAGSYTVRLIDEFGCESDPSEPEVITVNPIPATPVISASGDTDICPGDSVDLTSSDGDQYLWSTAETSKTIRVKTAGDYYVRVGSSVGCWSDTSLLTTITLKTPPAAPTISVSGPTDLCPGDSVDLTSSAGDTWFWSNGETTQSIRVKTAGSFTVQITDATTCLSAPSDTTSVTIKTPPAAPVITPSGPTDLCPGDSVDLTSSAGDTWLWSNGETTQSIRVKTAGNYAVQVTDATTCVSAPSDTTIVTIKTPPSAPIITPSGPTDLCPGDSVDLTSSAGDTWLWSNSETTQTIRVKTAGSYTVQVTDATTCLSAPSDTTSVTIKTPPAVPVITPSGPTSFCPGDSVDLSSSAGDTWLWSNGETTQTIRVKTAGAFSVQITDASGCLSDPSPVMNIVLYPEPGTPVITPGGSTDICETDSVSLASSAGSAWLWSTGESTQTVYARTAGDYTVQVSNAEGCWSPVSAITTVTTNPAPPKPTISFSGSTDFCEGDSLVLNSSAGDSYLWSTGETTPGITVKTSGSYQVRVSDATGCFSPGSDPLIINVNALPAKPMISGDTEYCAGDSVELSAPASSGYLWSSGDTTASIFVTSGGYTLSVSDANGCWSPASDPHNVSENPLPSKPVISGNDNYCQGDSTILSSSPATAYYWSSGENTQDISAVAGSYTVVVGDANGCLSPGSDPFVVSELPKPAKPGITADGPLDLWMGDSVTLSSDAAVSYLWSPGGETTEDIVVKTAGDYSVIVTDANGCTSDPSDPATVTILTLAKPVITIVGDTEFCEGSTSTVLSASEAFAYEWSNGDATQSIPVTASGSYTVRVFNEAGRSSEFSDPVLITVHPNPSLSLAARTNVICNGESTGTAEISVSGGTTPYSYLWSNGQTGTLASGLGAGMYLVTVGDANQCKDTMGVEIQQPEAIQIQEIITQPYCSDSYDGSIEISVSGGTPSYSILWSDGSTGTLLEGLGPETFDVEITDASECTATASYTMTYSNDNCVTVYEIITPNWDGHNDTWLIPGIEYYPQATVEVYDRWGKQVFFSRGYDQPWDGTFDGELLPMASYHYVINLNNGSPVLVGNITIVK